MEALGLLLAVPFCLVACIVTANYLVGISDLRMRRLVPGAVLLAVLGYGEVLITARYGQCGAYSALGAVYLWWGRITTFCAPPAILVVVLALGRHLGASRRTILFAAIVAAFVVGVCLLARNNSSDELYGTDGEGGGCVQRASRALMLHPVA